MATSRKRPTLRLVIIFSLFFVFLLALMLVFRSHPTTLINSYETCITAPGSKIQESYPAICVTSDGKRFIQPLSPNESVTDWKTYTNTKEGYTFQYPSTWHLDDSQLASANRITVEDNALDVDTNGNPLPTGIIRVDIDVQRDYTQWNYDRYLTYLDTGGASEGTELEPQHIKKIAPMNVAGIDTYIVEGGCCAGGYHGVFLLHNGRVYSIYLSERAGILSAVVNKYGSIFDQVLSTFVFLDTPANSAGPCGGIAGKRCPAGFTCQMTAIYPDAMGTCITNIPNADYTCPTSGYVDCMPSMDAAKKKTCSQEAMTWYEANCPNFKGGAL